jgi:hypothetical protein
MNISLSKIDTITDDIINNEPNNIEIFSSIYENGIWANNNDENY